MRRGHNIPGPSASLIGQEEQQTTNNVIIIIINNNNNNKNSSTVSKQNKNFIGLFRIEMCS